MTPSQQSAVAAVNYDTSLDLQERIRTRTARIGIIGLGYVGLPEALEFAKTGFRVTGFDIDRERVSKVNHGTSYIEDVDSAEMSALVTGGRLGASADFRALADMDVIHICVPTPLRKTRDPDISYIVSAVDQIKQTLRKGQLIILESTTYPGTTEDVVAPILASTGLKVGVDVHLCFSPERVNPGDKQFPLYTIPKVVGGMTRRCTEVATALYSQLVSRVVPVSSTKAAEAVKLLENTFRAVNIALANEFAIVCGKLGLDVWEIVDAAATKPFGFLPFYPGPGIGGHCLPTDPHYLSWRMRALDYKVRFIELADDVNRSMPGAVVDRVAEALNAVGKPVRGSRLLLLGVAYKGGVGDVRESPAFDVFRGLRARGASVEVFDPFVPAASFDGEPLPVVPRLDEAALRSFDGAVVVTDHPGVDYRSLVTSVPFVVDARNATKGLEALGKVWKL